MCGRYEFTVEESTQIRQILERARQRTGNLLGKTGEVRPTDLVPVLLPGGAEPRVELMTWGFPRPQGGVVINARSETVAEKPMFRESVFSRRCVIPSTGFYEWSRNSPERTVYRFRLPGEALLYMAGIWNTFREPHGGEASRFVILTTQANSSMTEEALSLFPEVAGEPQLIHHRMPVVLSRREVDQWLSWDADLTALLRREHVKLEKQMC